MSDQEVQRPLGLIQRAFELISTAEKEASATSEDDNRIESEKKGLESLVDEIVESLYPLRAKYAVFYTPGQIYGMFKSMDEENDGKNGDLAAEIHHNEDASSHARQNGHNDDHSMDICSYHYVHNDHHHGQDGEEEFFSLDSTPTEFTLRGCHSTPLSPGHSTEPTGSHSCLRITEYSPFQNTSQTVMHSGELMANAATELLRLLHMMSGDADHLPYVHIKLKSLMGLEVGLYELLGRNLDSMALLEYYILSSIYHGVFAVDADEVFLDMYKDHLVHLPHAMYFVAVNFLSSRPRRGLIDAFVEILSSIPMPLEFGEVIGLSSSDPPEDDDDSSIDWNGQDDEYVEDGGASDQDGQDGEMGDQREPSWRVVNTRGHPDRRAKEASYKRYVRLYSKLWMHMIRDHYPRHGLSQEALTTIVEAMPSHVFPFCSNPLLFVDLLIDLLSHSNLDLQILALKALFELVLYYGLDDAMISTVDNVTGMHKHGELGSSELRMVTRMGSNGDCLGASESLQGTEGSTSYFYLKLLKFLSAEYLESAHGRGLLQVLYAALKSSMLPVKLISSFIKRLVEVSCTTESIITNALLSIALDLLIRHHKHCIHLVSDAQNGMNGDKMANTVSHYGHHYGQYVMDEQIPLGNEREHLHELTLLLRHFSDATAKVCGIYHSDLRDKNVVKLNVDDFINLERNQLLRSIANRIKKTQESPFRDNVQKSTLLTTQLFNE